MSDQDWTERLLARIENNMSFHPGTPAVTGTYEVLRTITRTAAREIVEAMPYLADRRCLAIALTALEEAQMWAVKAVAVGCTPVEEQK